jgi:hypothetical protein
VLPTSVESCILIKAIKLTSRGVSPYFLARKHTRHRRGHADSRVFANGKAPTYFPYAQSHGPIFVKQTGRTARYLGFGRGRPPRRSRLSWYSPAHPRCRCGGMMISQEGQGEAAPSHFPQRSRFCVDHSYDRAKKLITTAFVPRHRSR